jgi:serine/threonine-protein kinase
MNCPQCNTILEDTARFCGACGKRLDDGPVKAKPQLEEAMKTMLADATTARPPSSGGLAGAPGPARPQPQVIVRQNPQPSTSGKLPSAASLGGPSNSGSMAQKPKINLPPPAAVGGSPSPIMKASAPPNPMLARPEPKDPFVGKVLNNRYAVEKKLGQGGFGAVYYAKQTAIGREVALKVLHPEMARDPNLVARFRREGAVACNLRDAHTVTTYDFDQTPDGTLYIAMELLKGRSLHEIFHDEAPLGWERVVHILEQMCSSLGEAHEQHIVHRDIKPENIYLEQRGDEKNFVKILDFGIAKIISGGDPLGGSNQSPQLTATGQTLGTLEYMSPEQLMGKQLDGRSDIYAMGVVGYELMTGRLPFPEATGPAELIAAQLKKTPQPPSQASTQAMIPPGVDAVILRMLEKDRNKRFPSALELKHELGAVLASGGLLAPTAQQPQPALPPRASTPPAASSRAPSQPAVLPQPSSPPVQQRQATQPSPPPGPATQDALAAVQKPRWWIWILVGAIVAGASFAAVYFALLRHK